MGSLAAGSPSGIDWPSCFRFPDPRPSPPPPPPHTQETILPIWWYAEKKVEIRGSLGHSRCGNPKDGERNKSGGKEKNQPGVGHGDGRGALGGGGGEEGGVGVGEGGWRQGGGPSPPPRVRGGWGGGGTQEIPGYLTSHSESQSCNANLTNYENAKGSGRRSRNRPTHLSCPPCRAPVAWVLGLDSKGGNTMLGFQNKPFFTELPAPWVPLVANRRDLLEE